MLAEKIRLFHLFSAFYGLNTSILPGMEPCFWTFLDLINVIYAPIAYGCDVENKKGQSVIWGCQYGPLRRLAVQMMLDLRQKSKKKRLKGTLFARK